MDRQLDPMIWGPPPTRMSALRECARNRWHLMMEALHHGRLHAPRLQHDADCSMWWGQGARCDCRLSVAGHRYCERCGKHLMYER